MDDIRVRSETLDDIKAIDVVNLSAFQGENEARLVTDLRQLPGYVPDQSMVAEFHNRIVGHLMLTPVALSTAEGEVALNVIAPMSVVPSQSHRGIGSTLVHTAIERSKSMGKVAIIVAAHPEFYSKFGFEKASSWNVSCNLPVPEEAVMLLELKEGALNSNGKVNYPPLFLEFYSSK